MFITRIQRTSRLGKRFGGDGLKYFVDCTDATNKSTCDSLIKNVTNQEILYSKDDTEPAIIKSILENIPKIHKSKNKTRKSHKTKSKRKTVSAQILTNKPIVIKTWYLGLGYENIRKEFDIGKQLQDIPGFIKYIAFIECKDNSYAKKTTEEIREEIRITKKSKPTIKIKLHNTKICEGTDDVKQLLLMPYYPMSSIGTHLWEESKSAQLRSLLEQILWSSYTAFVKYGFLHNDMHLQNFMIEPAIQPSVIYEIPYPNGMKTIEILIHGVQVIIMDFERSITDKYQPENAATKYMDISMMLGTIPQHKIDMFVRICKQKTLWEDFRRLFGELDDLNGVKPAHKSNDHIRIESQISSFVKDRIDLFSKRVLDKTFTPDQRYQILIQELYRMKLRNFEDVDMDALYENIQNALYDEIVKLYDLVSSIEFIEK